MLMSEEEKRNTSYHEAGHALVNILMPKADPVHKITIVPRGQALGLTSFLPAEELHNFDRQHMITRITVAMGGRAAEDLVFNEITTGAGGDIQQATQIARGMVTQYGMSDAIGPITLDTGEEQHVLGREIGVERPYGEDTAELIDQEVNEIISKCHTHAKLLLKENLELLHQLAKALMERETVDGAELEAMLLATGKTPGTPSGGVPPVSGETPAPGGTPVV